MADDIGGLSVSFTAEAAQLQGELRRMEQQLRAFDRAFGKQQVQLTATLRQPGARAVADMRRGIQNKIETDGGLRFTPKLNAPKGADLEAFSATLGRRVPAVTVKVKGVWDGWATPPPKTVTIGASGSSGAPAAAAAGVVRAPGATTTPRTGAHVASDATVRAREESRRRSRTGAAVAPVTRPAAQTAAQRRVAQLAANEARAAAQTQTASRSEVFRDYTDQMLLEDYLDPKTGPGHRNRLAAELRSRGFSPPPLTRTGEAAGPTGGARGFSGGGAPLRAGIYPHYTETGVTAIHSATVAASGRRGELTRPLQGMYNAYPIGGSMKRPGATVGRMAGAGLTEDSLARTMGRAIDKAGPMARDVGESWYQKAGPIIEGLSANMPQPRENRVMSGAVFSTQASWEENLRNAQDFYDVIFSGIEDFDDLLKKLRRLPVRAGKNPTMIGTIRKAWEVLNAANPEEFLRGPKGQQNPKISNFGGNLLGNLDLNTADRHETMGATGERFSTPSNRNAADVLERASRRAAQRRGLQTAQGQAIRWAGYLGAEIAGPDPHGFERSQGAAGNLWVPRRPQIQTVASIPRSGPNIAAFGDPTPRGLMRSPSENIDPTTGALTGEHMEYMGRMAQRERTPSERYARNQTQEWNRQQAQQSRMLGRWSSGPGVGIAAFNGGLRGPGGRFMSERQVEDAAGVGAPGAPNYAPPQRAAAGPATSPAAQAAIDLKSLSAAARDIVQMIERVPESEARLRQSVPDLFAEIDAARQKANVAASAPTPHLQTAAEIAMQRVQRITGGDSPDAERQREALESVRARTREAAGVQQTLSLGRTIGSMTAGVLGGTRDRERLAQVSRLRSEYERAGRAGTEAFENVAAAQVALDKATIQQAPDEEIQRLTKAYEEATAAAKPFRDAQTHALSEIETKLGQVNKPLAALRGSFSALSGAIIGGFAYSAAISGITALAGALEKPIDAIGGYIGAANRMQTSLGQTTRSMHGHADLAVAAAGAQSGLGVETAKAISPILEQRAAVQAGNDAFGEQIDLIRASLTFRAQQRSASRGEAYGLGITPGALPGISGSTGGVFGSAFGGQMPLIEQLAQLTPQGTRGQSAAFGAAGGLGGAVAGGLAGAAIGSVVPVVGTAFGALAGALGGGLAGAGLGGALGPGLAGFSDIDLSRGTLGGAVPAPRGPISGARGYHGIGAPGATAQPQAPANAATALAGLTDKQRDQIEGLGLAVDDLSEAAIRARPALEGQVKATVNATDAAAIAATAEAMKGWVPADQIEALQRSGFAVTDTGSGQALTRKDLQQWFQSSARGAGIPTPELAVEQSRMAVSAQLQLSQWQGQQQRGTMLPGQRYLSGLASGRLGVGGRRTEPTGIRELPPEIAASASNYEAGTEALTGLQQQMEATAQTGHTRLITMLRSADSTMMKATGTSSNLTGQFQTMEKSLAANGSAMRGLQLNNMWAQAGLQVAQYDEQIRIANRSLQDAISFQTGAGTGELGLLQNRARSLEIMGAEVGFQQQSLGLQGQQLGLQSASLAIRSRELALMQSQRQINFQLAMASFTAPGLTPEERAARIEEAKFAANIAQQQQNLGTEGLSVDREQVSLQAQQVALAGEGLAIAREQFAIQQAMVTVNAGRAVEDLTNQINLLQQARQVTITVTVNNEAIAAYQEQIAADMDRISEVIQEAYGVQQTVMQNAAQLAATYGERITDWNTRILNGLSSYLSRASAMLSGVFGGSGGSSVGGGTGGGTSYKGPTASGFYGSVSGATQFTVGEAGPETVAIIRNPRNLTMQPDEGSGGGGVVIHVDIHDNMLAGTDIDTFAATIARKVEEKLGQRAGMINGARRN